MSDWAEAVDPSSGRTYYYCAATGETRLVALLGFTFNCHSVSCLSAIFLISRPHRIHFVYVAGKCLLVMPQNLLRRIPRTGRN